jgi:DNA-binding transcriptional LysR family regulator
MAHSETPSIEDLRTLLAVADAGSETAATKVLGVTQPVVHRRLRGFRKPPALLRTQKGAVELTEAGQAALPAIRRFLRQYDHLRQRLAARRQRGALLTFGVGASVSQFYLARAIAAVQQRLPDWELQARVLRGKDRIAGVVDGALDAAIVSHDPFQITAIARWACQSRAELQIQELARLTLCVIAHRDAPEAKAVEAVLMGQSFPAAKLADLRLAGLDRESGLRRQVVGGLDAAGRSPAFVVEAGGWAGVKEFVRLKLCAGLMPLALLRPDEMREFVVRRLPVELDVVHRVVRRDDAENDALAEVTAALREAAAVFQDEVDRRWHGVL